MLLTVMCDYTADGLWLDGAATDVDQLIEEGFVPESFNKYKDRLEHWQQVYEHFDFWSGKVKSDDIISSKEFKTFLEEGLKLFKDIDTFVKENNLNLEVEYFNEEDHTRYKISNNKIVKKECNDSGL